MAFDWVGTNQRVEPEPRGKDSESCWIHANQGVITWTRPKLEQFKLAYDGHFESASDNFEFEGKTFCKGYAKYLIKYLDAVLA
jgi:hypothetical protein